MPVSTEPNRLNDILKWEQEKRFSREAVTVLSGENLTVGAVVGRVAKAIPTSGTADAGNTGNGTMTGVVGGADTKVGTYTVECITAAANGGAFKVIDPDGERLDDAAVGAAYGNDHLGFTVNDGSTDFAAGDKFTVAVAAGSGKVVAIDFAAVDGSQNAAGFAIDNYDASAADVNGVAIVRDAVIVADNLVWPAGATEGQKAVALEQLADLGIVARAQV